MQRVEILLESAEADHEVRKTNLARRRCVVLLAASLVLFLTGCPSVPQSPASRTLRELPGGIVEHTPSGMQFPSAGTGFTRVAVRHYDPAGMNVSAGYNSAAGSVPIAITVYVYPSPPMIGEESSETITRGEYERAKGEILQVQREAKLLGETAAPPPAGISHPPGWFGRFSYAANFAGAVRPVESLLYVYCNVGDLWTVKYRITYPADSFEARAMVNQFVQDLAWTMRKPDATRI